MSVPQVMRQSGLVQVVDIPSNSGNTREFSSIDNQEYAKLKDEGDEAERAQVQQGLITIALVKSSLINGRNLKTVIRRFMAILRKAQCHLQRLSERTLLISEATVRSA